MQQVIDWVQAHGGILGLVLFINVLLSSLKTIVEKVEEFFGQKPDGKINAILAKALGLLAKLIDIFSANKEH